ncbi:MAG TPA: helix-turn-helix domain-containing protein [Bacillota bacterium]|nr:helix-turn-helix domain-containing protein [Bacillota bacterium]
MRPKEVAIITPSEIKAALILKGITQASIAKKLGVSSSLVSMVIHGTEKSKKVRREIAGILGKSVRDIWRNSIAPPK